MRRGRPKHDDLLTPREWQVLDLLRQGLTNEEIAAELGIGVNGAKFHVSEIITKLGVRNRKQAAAVLAAPRARALGLFAFLRWPIPKLIGGAVLGIAALGLLLLAIGVGINDGRNNGRGGGLDAALVATTPTPRHEGTPTPTPTLTALESQLAPVLTTATARASGQTPTPAPGLAPIGQPIPVWVYADTQVSLDAKCLDLIEVMIPWSAPSGIPGKAVECTLDSSDRVTLTQRKDGFYHLESIALLLLLSQDLPPLSGPSLSACTDVIDRILPATEPSEAVPLVDMCTYVPPYRGEDRGEGMLVWGRVENPLAPATVPSDLPCENTVRYLGAPRDIDLDLRDVTCLLR